ncbi:MAG: hypothetical protein QXV69_08610 [Sulfolobaceae archaeon]
MQRIGRTLSKDSEKNHSNQCCYGGVTVGGSSAGAVSKRIDVSLLVAVLSGLQLYCKKDSRGRGEMIILSREKRNRVWVRA